MGNIKKMKIKAAKKIEQNFVRMKNIGVFSDYMAGVSVEIDPDITYFYENFELKPWGIYDANNADFIKPGLVYSYMNDPMLTGRIFEGGLVPQNIGIPVVFFLEDLNHDLSVKIGFTPSGTDFEFNTGWCPAKYALRNGMGLHKDGSFIIYPVGAEDFQQVNLFVDDADWVDKPFTIELLRSGAALTILVTVDGQLVHSAANLLTTVSDSTKFYFVMQGGRMDNILITMPETGGDEPAPDEAPVDMPAPMNQGSW
jgi:hypothetical protein